MSRIHAKVMSLAEVPAPSANPEMTQLSAFAGLVGAGGRFLQVTCSNEERVLCHAGAYLCPVLEIGGLRGLFPPAWMARALSRTRVVFLGHPLFLTETVRFVASVSPAIERRARQTILEALLRRFSCDVVGAGRPFSTLPTTSSFARVGTIATLPRHVLHLPRPDASRWRDALSRSRKKRWREAQGRFRRAGGRWLTTDFSACEDAELRRLFTRTREHFQWSESATRAHHLRLTRLRASTCRAAVLRAVVGGRDCLWMTALNIGDTMYCSDVLRDGPRSRRASAYFALYPEAIDRAAEAGLSRVDLGFGYGEIKARVGARPLPTELSYFAPPARLTVACKRACLRVAAREVPGQGFLSDRVI